MASRLACLLGFSLVAIAAGCAGGNPGSKVSGTVTQGGVPVSGGSIIFEPITGSGQVGSGTLKADGTYEVVGVSPGDYKVTVSTEHLKQTPSNTPKLPSGVQAPPSTAQLNGLTYVKIDLKYAKVATTDLSTTVAGKSHTYDIVLK